MVEVFLKVLYTLGLGLVIRVHPDHIALSTLAWFLALIPWHLPGKHKRARQASTAVAVLYLIWFHYYLASSGGSPMLAGWLGVGG